jgi:hypothetical protein
VDGAVDLIALSSLKVPHRKRFVGITQRADWLPTALQESFLSALEDAVVRNKRLARSRS